MNEPSNLNPLLNDTKTGREVCRLMFRGLAMLDNHYRWQPDLAEQIPTTANGGVSPDGRTVVWQLRNGLHWHDGVKITADDVLFTWKCISSGRSRVDPGLYAGVAAVEKIDEQRVKVTLRQPTADYVSMFDFILPAHCFAGVDDWTAAAFNRSPVGNGPFMFQDWLKGSEIRLTRYDGFHFGRPLLDGITIRYLPLGEMVVNLFKTGEINLASNIDHQLAARIAGASDARTEPVCAPQFDYLVVNTERPPLNELAVRQALAAAVDREQLAGQAYEQQAVMTVGDQIPISPYSLNPPPVTSRGEEVIRSLLENSGWKQENGEWTKTGVKLRLSLLYPANDQLRRQVAELLCSGWAGLGINVEPVAMSLEELVGDRVATGNFALALFSWNMPLTPDHRWLWWGMAENGKVNGNYSRWFNPDVNRLADQAWLADDQVKTANYQEIERIVVEQVPFIALAYRNTFHVVSNRLAGIMPGGAPGWGWWDAWQWGFVAK
ncbi:MAG: peptide ABC transporter substrate-binding protein [Negativicutes bacterium]|nr:peptide ABC transporter substrate-binding protein [Negativicutes bacterium]